MSRERSGEARRTLQSGIGRFPSNVDLLRALARVSIQVGRHRDGLRALARAHRLRPSDPELSREYQAVLARHGNSQERLEAELQPLLLEATGRYELDDADGALEVLKIALEKSRGIPGLSAMVHHRLATVQLGAGRLQEARGHLETALSKETGPTALRAEVLVSYAEVLLSQGHWAKAEKTAEQAVAIEPQNPLAFANLAIARSLGGKKTDAIRAFEKAFESGLARRLTLRDFLAIGPPVAGLEDHPDFEPMIRRAYPSSPYPPPPRSEPRSTQDTLGGRP